MNRKILCVNNPDSSFVWFVLAPDSTGFCFQNIFHNNYIGELLQEPQIITLQFLTSHFIHTRQIAYILSNKLRHIFRMLYQKTHNFPHYKCKLEELFNTRVQRKNKHTLKTVYFHSMRSRRSCNIIRKNIVNMDLSGPTSMIKLTKWSLVLVYRTLDMYDRRRQYCT